MFDAGRVATVEFFFLVSEFHFYTQVTTSGATAVATASSSSTAKKTTKPFIISTTTATKNISELAKNIIHVHSAKTLRTTASATCKCIVTKTIILCFFIGIV